MGELTNLILFNAPYAGDICMKSAERRVVKRTISLRTAVFTFCSFLLKDVLTFGMLHSSSMLIDHRDG